MNATDDPNELFVLVDKNDKVVGYQTRRRCHQDKNLIHRAVGVAIINLKREVLLQKRSRTKDLYPGFYTLAVTGHALRRETYLDAAQREVREELRISRKLNFKFLKKIIIPYEKETHMCVLFITKDEGPFNPDPREIESVKFFSEDEIRKKLAKGKFLLTLDAKEALKELGIIQ